MTVIMRRSTHWRTATCVLRIWWRIPRPISSIEVYDNISFADTGEDCPEALIASVSDFMLALVEVSFSVVYSRRGDGIKLSVRSEKSSLDAGKITAEALQGIGNGGGHAAMAGWLVSVYRFGR